MLKRLDRATIRDGHWATHTCTHIRTPAVHTHIYTNTHAGLLTLAHAYSGDASQDVLFLYSHWAGKVCGGDGSGTPNLSVPEKAQETQAMMKLGRN